MGRAYELSRRWKDAQRAYENMLATARESQDQEVEWKALIHLATLGTDMTTQPEIDDETYRGVKGRFEREAAETVDREGNKGGAGSSKPFEWSPDYAVGRAEEALTLARQMGRDDDLVAHSLNISALVEAWAGRWRGVSEKTAKTAEARRLFASSGDRVLEGETLTLHAWGAVLEGRPVESVRLGRERLDIAHELGERDLYLADSHGLVLALLEVGDYGAALSVAQTGAEAARALGHSARSLMALLFLGDACRQLNRLEQARSAYTEMSGTITLTQYQALTRSKLCAVAALEEDWPQAHTHAIEAARLRGEVVLQMTAPLHFHHEIEAFLRGDDQKSACQELGRFEAYVGESRRLHLAYLRAQAVLERWQKDTGASIESLREAETLAAEIGLPGELWQIRAELGVLCEERGEVEEAGRCFHQAAGEVQKLARKIADAELRNGFLTAPQVRRVLEKVERG